MSGKDVVTATILVFALALSVSMGSCNVVLAINANTAAIKSAAAGECER